MTVDYIETNIEILKGNVPIPFDTYLKISYSPARYIKIVSAHHMPCFNFWNKITENKVSKIYVKAAEEINMIEHTLNKALVFNRSKNYNPDSLKNMVALTQGVFSLINRKGLTEQSNSLLKKNLNEIVIMMQSKGVLFNFLSELKKENVSFYHAISRTVLSLAAAGNLQWKTSYSQSKIALAAVLCDYSLKDNFERFLRDPKSFSIEESDIYSTHMLKTVQMLESVRFPMGEEVKLAILHHHENFDGSGPLRVGKMSIYPLGHLIRIADEITKLTVPSSHNLQPMSLLDAIVSLKESRNYSPTILSGYLKLI